MTKEYNRCDRIAELLLIENEVLKLESVCPNIEITGLCWYRQKIEKLTPIEKIMYAILKRISCRIEEDGLENHMICKLGAYVQKQIGKYKVDFCLSSVYDGVLNEKEIIIECDGHDFHEKTKEQAKHDKERDRFFTSNGYKVLRYTGSEIYNDFEKIEDELYEMLSPESELWK